MDAAFPALWGRAGADPDPKKSTRRGPITVGTPQRDLFPEPPRFRGRAVPGASEIVPEPPYVGPLGNNVVSATPGGSLEAARAVVEGERRHAEMRAFREARALRFHLRRVSSWMTTRTNVGKCGRCRYLENSVGIQLKGGRAHFTGLVHCGSAWECPVCMYTISARRAEEVRTVVAKHRAAGGGAYMLTLTLPHDAGDDLRPLRQHVTRAWSKVQAGAPYKRWKARLGIVGTIRALEVTHGPNGWHPHLHVLILTASSIENAATGQLTDDAIAYKNFVFSRWVKWITQPNDETGKTYRAPSDEHGVTLVPSHRDEYIAKLGLADELTRGSWKKGESVSRHRTPLQILSDIWRASKQVSRGNPRDRALWMEYAENMYRAKQLTWSRGLRDLYELGDEQTDLDIVSEDERSGKLVGFVRSELWDTRVKWNVDVQLRILAMTERWGVEGFVREIDRLDGLPDVPF